MKKQVKKKLLLLSKVINENHNSSKKKIKSLHENFFLSPLKIRRSERIAKKNFDK